MFATLLGKATLSGMELFNAGLAFSASKFALLLSVSEQALMSIAQANRGKRGKLLPTQGLLGRLGIGILLAGLVERNLFDIVKNLLVSLLKADLQLIDCAFVD